MAILYQREITIFNQSGNGSDLRLLYFVAVLLLINDNIEKNYFRFVCIGPRRNLFLALKRAVLKDLALKRTVFHSRAGLNPSNSSSKKLSAKKLYSGDYKNMPAYGMLQIHTLN